MPNRYGIDYGAPLTYLDGTEGLSVSKGGVLVDTTTGAIMGPQVIYSGVVADGVTDDTIAWVALFNKITTMQANGVSCAYVVLPGGVSICSVSLSLTLTNFYLILTSVGNTTLQFSGLVDGLNISLTNGSNFRQIGISIQRPNSANMVGTGFALSSDGTSQPLKHIEDLQVTGSWLVGAKLLNISNVVLDNLTVSLSSTSNSLTNGQLSIGFIWSGAATGASSNGMTVNNVDINGANTGFVTQYTVENGTFNGGSIASCNFGVNLGLNVVAPATPVQSVQFNGTSFYCTTTSVTMENGTQLCSFLGNLHEPDSAYPSLNGAWSAFYLNGAPSNTVLNQNIQCGAVSQSSFIRLYQSPNNRVAECLVQGCTTYGMAIDVNSYGCSIAGINGAAANNVTGFLDPASVLSKSEITDLNWNGQLTITPGLLISGSNIFLLGAIFGQQYATDAAAGAAGLTTGNIYRNTSNQIMWKT